MNQRGQFSAERYAEIQDRLWDRETMRVYCDTSLNPKTKLMALAAFFVFDGESDVYTKVLGAPANNNNVTGEIAAVKFAITQIPVFQRRTTIIAEPETIIIYSDCNLISLHVQDRDNIKIEYIGEDKRHNPFYIAAHNAARKAIYLKPKSGRFR